MDDELVVCADESDRGLRDRSDGARSTPREQELQQTATQCSYEPSSDYPQASLTNSKGTIGTTKKQPPTPNKYCTITEPFLVFPAQSTRRTFHWCEYRVRCV
jgi:hypothetical protein